MALDADLVLDSGLIPFSERVPGPLRRVRHRRAGHGVAGGRHGAGRAAAGRPLVRLLPLDPPERADLQQRHRGARRSSTSGSLAGLLPGGPGHSHQSVRDISALGAMPGMALIEPTSEHEVELGLSTGPSTRRPGPCTSGSSPCRGNSPFELPRLERARARPRQRSCARAATACSSRPGPVMVSQAWRAAELLAERGHELRRGRAAVAERRRRRLALGGCRRRADLLRRQPLLGRRAGRRGARRAGRPARRGPRASSSGWTRSRHAGRTTRCCERTGSTPSRWPRAGRASSFKLVA